MKLIDRSIFTRQTLKNNRLFFALVLLFVFVSAYGHGGATGIVKERMDSMETLKDTMKSLRTMIIKDKGYDAAELKRYARVIEDHAGEYMIDMFPEGSLDKPTEAKVELWEEWGTFTTMANDLESLAVDLGRFASATNSKETKNRFKLIADNCSDCHDKYRE